MNFFLKGDFKIDQSWEQKKGNRQSRSRDKSRDKEKNNSLVNVGKNIMGQPSHDMLDDALSKRILKEFAAERPPSVRSEKKLPKEDTPGRLPPRQKPTGNALGGENDLMASMAGRLKTVEMTVKNQRHQIEEKKQVIEKLKGENTFLRGLREDAPKQLEKMKNLQVENAELKAKVAEMEEYLKKYGLKWVGNKIEGKLEHEKMKKAIAKGNYQYRMPREIDINTVIRRVEELNAGLHSEGMGTEVYADKGVHKFRKAEALPMGFFANGIAIKGFNFFTYQSKESLQILSDLLDGYFPYVLKHKYPNGVFLKVMDKVAERFNQEGSQQAITTFQSKEQNEFKAPSKEQFLSKLPKQVVRKGKVINIRGEIQKRLNGEGAIPEEKEDEESDLLDKQEGGMIFKSPLYAKLQEKLVEQDSICTLKIRDEKGEAYILHLEVTSRVKDIYSWMQRVISGGFRILGNFPRREYLSDEPENLSDLGFCPNGMLHIRKDT